MRVYLESHPSMQSTIYTLNPRKWQLKGEDDLGDYYVNRAGIVIIVKNFRGEPKVPDEFSKKAVIDYYDKKANPRFAFGLMKHDSGIRNVDVKLCYVGNVKSFLTIYALPQTTPGLMFVATLTVPFKNSCLEFKCQLAEKGLIGYRETVIATNHGAKADCYDVAYDKEFPDHPLTVVRRVIYKVVNDITIKALNRPPFYD